MAGTTADRPMIEPIAPDTELQALLEQCELPVADLFEEKAMAFFGCREDGNLVAVVGMETGIDAILLRSLAVAPAHRGHGLARRLVAFVEHLAGARGKETLFLLTDSAPDFFRVLGYIDVPRERAPDWIRAGAQFSELCPGDAAFLSKSLRA
jgi:N-acetylglutamate synthase-like GNAT family acetyltransferase